MYQKLFLLCLGYFTLQLPVYAEEVHVGAIFSSLAPLHEIIRLFEKMTTDKVILHMENMTSKGLYQQVKSHADLDIVVSGNVDTPIQLEQEGFVLKDGRITYAFGKLVLWSKKPALVDSKGEVLKSGNFRNIVILDRKNAAYGYGMASRQVLEELHLWDKLQDKLVFMDNSGEIYKQVSEDKFDLAFIPLATLNPNQKVEGSLWIVPKSYYSPIEQQAVLLKKAENNSAARSFFNYLRSPHARNIFEKYGFSLP